MMMKFITDKVEWTTAMKEFAEEQLTKKLEGFNVAADNATVKFYKLNDRFVKVTVILDDFRAQSIESDFYMAMKITAAKIKALVAKSLDKPVTRAKIIEDNSQEYTMTDITREKILFVESISADEAISRFEKTDYGFYLFKDIDTNDTVSVLYKRPDHKSYGVIRCK